MLIVLWVFITLMFSYLSLVPHSFGWHFLHRVVAFSSISVSWLVEGSMDDDKSGFRSIPTLRSNQQSLAIYKILCRFHSLQRFTL